MNLEANGYRLPTEAEWEYAARGGEEYVYAGSNDLNEVGWYYDNSGGETHPVAKKNANGYGLYDMSGNVYEWCWDGYGDYEKSKTIDPVGNTSSIERVRRGGGRCGSKTNSRVARRRNHSAHLRYYSIGVRFFRTKNS